MSAIPTIGFFAPLPLPMMIPFMGIQSAVMAEQFGTMFQYGKRRISAMSNEEFNALTPEKLQQDMTRQLEGMIPEMEKQIQAMQPLVQIILKEFGAYITLAGTLIFHEAQHLAGAIPAHGTPETTVTHPEEHPDPCPAGSHWDATRGQCLPDESTITTSPSPTPETISPGDNLYGTKSELEQQIETRISHLNVISRRIDEIVKIIGGSNSAEFNDLQTEKNALKKERDALLLVIAQMHQYYFDTYGFWYVAKTIIWSG